MSKSLPIEIKVENPCSENWEGMTLSADGRFCDKCQKEVIDFTTWSDAALYRFFANRGTRVCGRFLDTQLNKPINIPYQPQSRLYRLTIALGLTLICGQSPHALAQDKAPKIAQTVIVQNDRKNKSSGVSNGMIYGKVSVADKKPVPHIIIYLYKDGYYNEASHTNNDGDFAFRALPPGNYDLTINRRGYDSITVNNIVVSADEHKLENISLTEKKENAGQVILGDVGLNRPYRHRLKAEIFGHITDTTGNFITNAAIAIYKKGKLKARSLANIQGEYDVKKLKTGAYTIQITHPSYKTITLTSVELYSGENLHNIVMEAK